MLEVQGLGFGLISLGLSEGFACCLARDGNGISAPYFAGCRSRLFRLTLFQ